MDQKAALEALEANIVEACTNHELVHEGRELPKMRVHRDGLLREIWRPR